jgi:hypothetical protein
MSTTFDVPGFNFSILVWVSSRARFGRKATGHVEG